MNRHVIYILIAITLLLPYSCVSCGYKDNTCFVVRDSAGNQFIIGSTDSCCCKVTYYLNSNEHVCFEYEDVLTFNSDDSPGSFFSRAADNLYGEDRAEIGYTAVFAILFDKNLQIVNIRFISKLPEPVIEKLTSLIRMSEGEWHLADLNYSGRPYYLKILQVRFQ